jgi:anion-transporting  ArsA/GET3 family ATPase
LVERFVSSPPARRRILSNSFYRGLSRQFAGAEAYAALDQCFELHTSGQFEAAVVDTPPAAQAFELIEAPAHLLRLLDSRAARLLAQSGDGARSGLKLAGTAVRFVTAQLEQFAGVKMLSSIGDFFATTAEAAGALSDRLRAIDALLKSPAVQFVVVTTAEPNRLAEAYAVVKRMDSEGLRLRAIVLNRLMDQRSFAAFANPAKAGSERASARQRRSLIIRLAQDPKLAALARFLEQHTDVVRGNLERAVAFAAELPPRIELIVEPEFDGGLRDLGGLRQVADVIALGGGRRLLAAALAAHSAEPRRRARTRR